MKHVGMIFCLTVVLIESQASQSWCQNLRAGRGRPGYKQKENPTRPANIFGVRQENQTEVFVAGDVSQKVEQAVRDALAAAVDVWGSSGRFEYWVLGTDRAAALELAEVFCTRRVARGDMSEGDCRRDSLDKDHGFLHYQEIGANALATGRAHGSAGHNGGAEWGIHRMASSLPLGLAGLLGISAENEQITILHEYWHSVQHSFIQTKDHRRRRQLLGPVWFVEGSAVAMAELTAPKLWQAGKLSSEKEGSRLWENLEKRMIKKMRFVQSKRQECSNLLPTTYGGDCGKLAYDSGGWAIAYLLHKFGDDVLLKSFHPTVETLGWEGAFQRAFGQSSGQFLIEFERFIDLPLSEQVGILPQQ